MSGDDDTTTSSSGAFFAACDDHPDGGWKGPNRSTRDEAQADADAHNEKFGHSAAVIG
jgi:hypothetical protein